MTDAAKAISLTDAAYAALRAAILANEFPPGHQISTQELAVRLGMSRTPVQEAALKLQQERLVEILPKRGIRIRPLSVEELSENYDVLIAIESVAAERLAALDSDHRKAVVRELQAATERMRGALASGDLEAWGQADAAFHQAMIQHCGNGAFAAILATVNAQSHRARMLTLRLRGNLDRSISEHQAIIDAIAAGSSDQAFAAARAHRARARAELLPLLAQVGLKHL